MARAVRNPAWANDVIALSWEQLERLVPAWMPRLEAVSASTSGKRPIIVGEAREYGCGAYGCVYPTLDDLVVMKITTDDTEGEFAATLAPTLQQPICVEYHKVIKLGVKHEGKHVYLLWRQEANLVGHLVDVVDDDKGSDVADEIHALISDQHRFAQIAFAVLRGARMTSKFLRDLGAISDDPATVLNDWAMTTTDLTNCGVPYVEDLFQGILDVYRAQRIFFGDLHVGNLGAVPDTGAPHGIRWVITDPGHVAVVHL